MSTDKFIFEVKDPKGRVIRLAHKTWQDHILTDNDRWEFRDPSPIKSAVGKPHLVVKSDKVPDAQVFYRKGAHPEYPHLWVKVPVRFWQPQVGTISTAMLTHSVSQGTDKKKGGLIYVNWRR